MRLFLRLCSTLAAAALYVSLSSCATPPAPPEQAPQPAQPQPAPLTEAPPPDTGAPLLQAWPQPQVEVQPLSPDQPAVQETGSKPEPHIALMLPLKSPSLGRAAEAVRQGFLAAAASQSPVLPIRVYSSTEEAKEIAGLYRQALADGAVVVAGPLTRDGVAALVSRGNLTVPTLALNSADARGPDQLYSFSLSLEAEARQIAQLAAVAKLRYATIVTTGSPLSRRLTQAFSDEWKNLGGSITEEILFNNNPAELALLPTAPDGAPAVEMKPAPEGDNPDDIPPPAIAPGNMVFLAADIEKARIIRPYLNAALPVYATSQVFNSNADTLTNYDLDNLHLVSMPWLLQPDHPAVMIYPRASPPLEPDMERLYAFGIDAFRLTSIMVSNNYYTTLPLDGVTGRIRLVNRQFVRDALPAQIRQGRGQLLESRIPNTLRPLFSPSRP